MGKILIIKGADFSANAIDSVTPDDPVDPTPIDPTTDRPLQSINSILATDLLYGTTANSEQKRTYVKVAITNLLDWSIAITAKNGSSFKAGALFLFASSHYSYEWIEPTFATDPSEANYGTSRLGYSKVDDGWITSSYSKSDETLDLTESHTITITNANSSETCTLNGFKYLLLVFAPTDASNFITHQQILDNFEITSTNCYIMN